jgi:hypothetical protein
MGTRLRPLSFEGQALMGCYEKLWCCAAHGQGRAGRRVASRKTLPQRFLIATAAGKVFPQPLNPS